VSWYNKFIAASGLLHGHIKRKDHALARDMVDQMIGDLESGISFNTDKTSHELREALDDLKEALQAYIDKKQAFGGRGLANQGSAQDGFDVTQEEQAILDKRHGEVEAAFERVDDLLKQEIHALKKELEALENLEEEESELASILG